MQIFSIFRILYIFRILQIIKSSYKILGLNLLYEFIGKYTHKQQFYFRTNNAF